MVPVAARSNGLDTLRALAIVLVFAYHYKVFVSGAATFGWASDVGWVGVDLFFVLSGYLIANQVLAGLAQGKDLSLSAFYARRVLRTWPLYWVVLAAYFLFPSEMGGRTPPPLWRFLTFTQNIGLQPGTAFSHAWSLCIEEQFYLLLPLVVLGLRAAGGSRRAAWVLLAALMALGMLTRSVLWQSTGSEADGIDRGYYTAVYYASWCRADEFLPGVAVALLKNGHPALWARVRRSGRALFWSGVLASVLALYGVREHFYQPDVGYGYFMTTFGYALIAMAFALLVASALMDASPLQRIRIPGALHLAQWSYAIYLSHKAVAFILGGYAKRLALGPVVTPFLIAIASVAMGVLLHRLIERPVLQWRERRWPELFQAIDRPCAARR